MTTYLKDKNEFKDWLSERIKSVYYNSSKTHLICHCPDCEENRTKNTGHCYISLEIESGPVYYCFKCESHGHISKLIKFLGGNPEDFVVQEILDSYSPIHKKIFGKNNKINKVNNSFNYNNSIHKNKIDYLKKRIHGEFDIRDIPNLIIDLEYFVKNNNIIIKDVEYLNKNFIGFLTSRNSKIILRNTEEEDLRYKVISLRDDLFYKDFYSVQLEEIKYDNEIVLCEGIFDLLNIRFNERIKPYVADSTILCAALGNSFSSTILSILDFCRVVKCKFKLFSDSDLIFKKINNLKYLSEISSLEVYWNKAGKDFGNEEIDIDMKKII